MYILRAAFLALLAAVSVQAEFRYRCCRSEGDCNDCADINCNGGGSPPCEPTLFKFCNDVSPRIQQVRTTSQQALIPDTVRPRK
jgi:hypothetical protein